MEPDFDLEIPNDVLKNTDLNDIVKYNAYIYPSSDPVYNNLGPFKNGGNGFMIHKNFFNNVLYIYIFVKDSDGLMKVLKDIKTECKIGLTSDNCKFEVLNKNINNAQDIADNINRYDFCGQYTPEFKSYGMFGEQLSTFDQDKKTIRRPNFKNNKSLNKLGVSKEKPLEFYTNIIKEHMVKHGNYPDFNSSKPKEQKKSINYIRTTIGMDKSIDIAESVLEQLKQM